MLSPLPSPIYFKDALPTKVGAYLYHKPKLTEADLKRFGFNTYAEAAKSNFITTQPVLAYVVMHPSKQLCLYTDAGPGLRIVSLKDLKDTDCAWTFLSECAFAKHELLFSPTGSHPFKNPSN